MRSERIVIFLWYWVPFIVYTALIFFLSHQSDPLGGYELPVSDKIAHGIEYCILIGLAIRAFRHMPVTEWNRYAVRIALCFCFLYAMSDEWHQLFIPERESSLFDLCADSVGMVLGVILFRRFPW